MQRQVMAVIAAQVADFLNLEPLMHLTRAAVLNVLRSLDTPLLPNADDAIPKTELWWLRPVRLQFVHEQARFPPHPHACYPSIPHRQPSRATTHGRTTLPPPLQVGC